MCKEMLLSCVCVLTKDKPTVTISLKFDSTLVNHRLDSPGGGLLHFALGWQGKGEETAAK